MFKLISMKKIIALLCCLVIIACDDGNFDAPAFDFEETVYGCDVINSEHVLYRLASSESLIVTLTTSQLKNEVGLVEVPISSTNVVYRTFSSEVTQSYFCQSIPPTEPEVLANWVGAAGSDNIILIDTVEELNDNDELIGYRHSISFENLRLESGQNFIVYEVYDFGEYVTDL